MEEVTIASGPWLRPFVSSMRRLASAVAEEASPERLGELLATATAGALRAADPGAGLRRFETLAAYDDADVAWIARENAKKTRLAKLTMLRAMPRKG